MNETNKQPSNNDESRSDTNTSLDNASFDLKAAAAEAIRLTKIATGEAVSTETKAETSAETKTSAEVKTENITATAPETKNEGSTENTTNDLQQEAFKAMKLEAERRREEEERAAAKSVFSKGTRLKLQVTESGEVMTRDVVGDLVVGRADNVTDYIPEIDLTPYGAYRLGLSRRHAIILLEGERLVVKDLNSRNGTFVNGVIVPSGGTQALRDGDELRFGNLGLKVNFERH